MNKFYDFFVVRKKTAYLSSYDSFESFFKQFQIAALTVGKNVKSLLVYTCALLRKDSAVI